MELKEYKSHWKLGAKGYAAPRCLSWLFRMSPICKGIFTYCYAPWRFSDEDKEKIQWGIRFAKLFGSKIHVIVPNAFDSGVQKKINNNLSFAKMHIESNGLDWEIHNAAKGKSFQEEIVNLATDIEAELIIVMTTPNIDLTDFVFGAQEQYVIANKAKIPVLCINPGTLGV